MVDNFCRVYAQVGETFPPPSPQSLGERVAWFAEQTSHPWTIRTMQKETRTAVAS